MKSLVSSVLLLASSGVFAKTNQALSLAPTLTGAFTQGALIRGKTQPGAVVQLDGKAIKVSSEGYFVFGFGRDAQLTHELTVTHQKRTFTQPLVLASREYKTDKITGVEKKYVSPPKSVLARIKQDNAQIHTARHDTSERLDFLQSFVRPAEGRISGVYGSQRVFNGVPKRPHFGLDIANKTGTKVVSPIAGRVVLAVNDMYYSGGTLIVDHGFGVTSTFIHLSKITVSVGDEVKQGDKIAEIGATGRVTGPHLDWRINWYNERLDPALVMGK